MDDASIIELYWQRAERAIAETDAVYGLSLIHISEPTRPY